ncbi:class I SAM-dependent methyltransferase [Aeromonas caviae]|uniref:class I SAM-dependent methyltransferase n=1 Tax=Aeromonas caviae TaxID=648 RepID=UPI0030151455
MNLYQVDKLLVLNNENGPETLLYNGRPYYRYMDRLYIPKEPSELDPSEVSQLSELRLKFAGEIIDYDYSLEVIKRLYNLASPKKNGSLIDFGCGGGIIIDCIKTGMLSPIPRSIIGLDISDFAVSYTKKQFLNNHLHPLIMPIFEFDSRVFKEFDKINVDSNSIDTIISSFVMHFKVYEGQMNELYRVLKPGRKFVYNDYIYSKYMGHTKKTLALLKLIGFEVETHVESFIHNGLIKHQLFVSATKPEV